MARILPSGERGKEFAFRDDSPKRRSFLAMTAMIDKRQRARGETRFRLKGPQKRPTVVRYRWAISGRNARRRSVEGLSKPRLTRRRIQRTRMIYRSKVGIIPLSLLPSPTSVGLLSLLLSFDSALSPFSFSFMYISTNPTSTYRRIYLPVRLLPTPPNINTLIYARNYL